MAAHERFPHLFREVGKAGAAVVGCAAVFGVGGLVVDEHQLASSYASYDPTSELLMEYDDGAPGFYFEGHTLADAQEVYNDAKAELIRAEQSHEDIIQSMPGACVNALEVYLPGGVLADVKEDSAVTDLVGDPDQPCGDTPALVRERLVLLENAELDIQLANEFNADAQNYVQVRREIAEKDESVDGTQAGIKFGAIVGALGSASVVWRKHRERKRITQATAPDEDIG